MYLRSALSFLQNNSLGHIGIIVYTSNNDGLVFKKLVNAKRIVDKEINFKKAIMNLPRYFLYEQDKTLKGKIQREIVEILSDKKMKIIWNKFLSLRTSTFIQHTND